MYISCVYNKKHMAKWCVNIHSSANCCCEMYNMDKVYTSNDILLLCMHIIILNLYLCL